MHLPGSTDKTYANDTRLHFFIVKFILVKIHLQLCGFFTILCESSRNHLCGGWQRWMMSWRTTLAAATDDGGVQRRWRMSRQITMLAAMDDSSGWRRWRQGQWRWRADNGWKCERPLSHIQISRNIANMPHKRFELSHKIAKKVTQLCVNFHVKK